MYRVNDCVVYGMTGLCRIVDIRNERFGGTEEQAYYVLKPLYNPGSTTYVSTADDELVGQMRPVISRDGIDDLLAFAKKDSGVWIEADRDRSEAYGAQITSGDRYQLISLLKSLHVELEKRKQMGRKLNQSDAKTMGIAERILHEELAFVLGISVEEVVPFILARVS